MSYIGKQPRKAALTASDIEDGIITAAKIEDGAVVAAEIASNAVTTAKINADAVTGAKIADDVINSEHIVADSIDAEHYAAGSVDTTALGADAVTGAKIADDAINSEHYTDGSIDTAHIADGQVTADKIASGVIPGASNAFRNLYINGDMSVAQRATTITGITSSTYNTIDRLFTGASSAGTWTQSQSTDVPTGQGFATSAKMDCTTANTSLGSSARLQINQKFEGQNLQYLKKGTSSAESLTLSFWVKSNKTGTYICEFLDADNSNRHINKSYTISSANTWEKKTITYPGDTSGAFDNDNGDSFSLNFWLVAGSQWQSGTLQTSWGSNTSANRAVGQVNLADSTDNNWYITGIQVEAGTSASDFEFLPHDVNFTRCQRYCQFIGKGSTSIENIVLSGYTSTNAYGSVDLPTKMRSAPSLTYTTTNVTLYNNGNSRTISSKTTSVLGHSSVGLKIVGSGWSASHALHLVNSDATNGLCKLDAEL